VDENPKFLPKASAAQLPFVENPPSDGRSIVLYPFFDHETSKFHVWIEINGKLTEINALNLFSGSYVSRAPADEITDYPLPLSTGVFQHFSFPPIIERARLAEQDLINGLASLQKYGVLLEQRRAHPDSVTPELIKTELEYAFANHRSFYDQLHKIVTVAHGLFHPAKVSFRDSFARLAEKSDLELARKYHLPDPLVAFYSARREVFLLTRKIRDNIFHHGHTMDADFGLEDGFAVHASSPLCSRLEPLGLWPNEIRRNGTLCSVLPLFAFLVRDMFRAGEELSAGIQGSFAAPPQAVAPSMRVFLRSTLTRQLRLLDEYIAKQWMDPAAITGK
jgi:hypothetical protein